MPIVYLHKRKDNGRVFYIGIGKNEKRAYTKYGRNSHWHNVANVYGYDIEITHKDIIWQEACVIEKYLIYFYGRLDTKKGSLVNKTNGGDGAFGVIISDELRKRYSLMRKGQKKSDVAKENIRKAKIGSKNPSYGKIYSQDERKKMSEILKKIKSTDENKIKVSNFHKGKILNSEHKRKIGLANSRPQQKIECPHCNLIGGIPNMKRYHFESCKLKKN